MDFMEGGNSNTLDFGDGKKELVPPSGEITLLLREIAKGENADKQILARVYTNLAIKWCEEAKIPGPIEKIKRILERWESGLTKYGEGEIFEKDLENMKKINSGDFSDVFYLPGMSGIARLSIYKSFQQGDLLCISAGSPSAFNEAFNNLARSDPNLSEIPIMSGRFVFKEEHKR